MRILLIHQVFVTPEEGGGTRHYELAKYLIKKGHRVSVIASDIDYLTGKKKEKDKETKDGIEIIYASTYQTLHKNFFYRALSFLSFSLSSFIKAFKVKNVDIIWGTSPPLFQALTSFLVSKIKKIPFVFEVRDLWVDFAEELGVVKNRFAIKCMKFLEKILYRSCCRVIVNSPGFIPFIEKHTSRDKIVLVPNGVITSEFNVGVVQNSFRAHYSLNSKFISIYLGNIGVANDIETILRAAEQLREYKDIVFVIMGGGIKKEVFKNYIFQNKLSNVLLLDSQPKSKIPEILSDIDVCIATLKNIQLFKTTYPNKVFDYMAAGKPTILAIDGVIREVIELSSGGIYVCPGNSQEIVRAIFKYYKNPELKEEHGLNARDYVKKHFEREKITDELEKILLEILERQR
jgi:glycosyltransferase involved in cell wall biosynthesis